MAFYPFEITTANLIYACLGGFIVLFSMVSILMKEKLYIGEVVFGTVFGIIIGPYCANIFNPRGWGDGSEESTNAVTLEVMRIVLATGVFAIGVELSNAYMRKYWRSLANLVVPVMLWGWLVCAALFYAFIPGINFLSSLVIAACLTPTDPILAAAIVGGKYADDNVPMHLRKIIAAESAANDGLAYPFLFLALDLTLEPTVGTAIRKWITVACLYQVVLGAVIGAVVGYIFKVLMKYSEKKGYIGGEAYAIQYLSLALLSIGITTLLGNDDLLAAFAAGCTVSWDGHFNEKAEEHASFATTIEILLNCACFVYIGAILNFRQFNLPELGIEPWRLVVIFLIMLVVRRIPPLLLLYRWIPEVHNWREALFAGHFGPMGVGAVFISTMALEHLPHPHDPPIGQTEHLAAVLQPIVLFVVLGSIIIHGMSIPFLTFSKMVRTMSRTMSATTWSRHPTRENEPTSLMAFTPNIDISKIVRSRDIDLERAESHQPPATPTTLGTATPARLSKVMMSTVPSRADTPANDLPSEPKAASKRDVTFNKEAELEKLESARAADGAVRTADNSIQEIDLSDLPAAAGRGVATTPPLKEKE
ncbi:hypothetical protein BOTBODRAFT_31755 [Botryobasidium botryosum FD-172 SS1]|uniref:Cation/H+ exchanger transmembrane domain-containing protein n=1 Tax=Botryobasidium botryosum (strain FD-172 SS1) TaxID=930990 RepID=A0A067MIS3_BOTB1|nr:hypothetical protein BOTBODRAFT_31755 [Botryobasidium botryosum FD-172 SS1]